MRIVGILGGLVALAAGSCGPVSEEPGATETAAQSVPRFDGMLAAGTPEDAKASGFTECVAEGNGHYGFSCVRPGATLFGAQPLQAVVRLDYPYDYPHDAPRTPDKTVYSSITYEFAPSEGYETEGCEYERANPYACTADQSEPLPTLTRVLKAQGWLGRSARWGAEYVKPGGRFKININTRSVYSEIGGQRRLVEQVDVYPSSEAESAELVAMIRAEQQQRTSTEDANTSFVESMEGKGQ